MLTEKEKMQRAKFYMLKLANGFNPIDNTKLNDSVLQNERLIKCFEYIAGVLDNNINSINPPKTSAPKRKSGRKTPFSITQQQIQQIKILEKDCALSEIVTEINRVIDENTCKKITARNVNDWLVYMGYLQDSTDESGKLKRQVTPSSAQIGIQTKTFVGIRGEYQAVVHSPQSQRFIVEHLNEIAKFTNGDDDDV